MSRFDNAPLGSITEALRLVFGHALAVIAPLGESPSNFKPIHSSQGFNPPSVALRVRPLGRERQREAIMLETSAQSRGQMERPISVALM